MGTAERRDLSFVELSANWSRLKDVFPAKDGYSLWGSEGVRPDDIKQGQIGNCWFLSGAAAVAEQPERLQSVFLNQELSSEGIYGLQMYALGVPVTITIDDNVPLWDSTTMTLFANIGKDKSLWAPLLEKAFAKMHGNYEALVGGFAPAAIY